MTPRIDILAGAILAGIAAASLYQAAGLDMGTLRSLGPGLLPTILSSILLACGLALLAIGILKQDSAAEYFSAAFRGPALIGGAVLLFALTIEGTELGPFVMPRLGLAVIGPITLVLAGYGSVEARLRDLAAVGCGLTAFCLALFNDVLGMDIPVVPGALEAPLINALGGDAVLRASYALLAAGAALLAVFRTTEPRDA